MMSGQEAPLNPALDTNSKVSNNQGHSPPGPNVLTREEPAVAAPAVDLSLVIPAYDEEHRLDPTLDRYAQALRARYGDAFEIIVIVNGSDDRTAQVAVDAHQRYPQIRVYNIPDAVGKGRAVLAGFALATGPRVIFADADGSTEPASLITLADTLDEHDIVIGSRHLPGSIITTPQPLLRRLLGRAFNLAVRLLFDLPYRDTQCGAKAFRLDAACWLAEIVAETHWAFDVDLLLTAEMLGMDIAEVPVVWGNRAGSRLTIVPTLWEVGRAFWRLRNFRVAPRRIVAARKYRSRFKAVPNVADVTSPLRILALNWRCSGHAEAGGAELNLSEQAWRWARAGHAVTIICSLPGSGPTQAKTDQGVTIQRMGGRFTIYPLVALELLRHGRRFDRILDVANGIPFFAPLFTRTPVTLLVHHVHNRQWFAEFPKPVAVFGWFLERYVVPLIYRWRPVIAVSPTTQDALTTLGFSHDQIRVIYNGNVPPERVPEVAHTQPRVVYVGRIKRYKRLGRLVKAVAQLRQEFPEIRLDIAGDGDARPELEALIDRLGLRDIVSNHGFVDDARKAELLAGATVFATPSMHEGWGLCVIEANAYGCPAVAYDVPGLRVAIRNRETGLLAHSDGEFREAIALLLRNPELRAQYGEAAKQWAARFDWEAAAKDTLRVLAADDPLQPVAPYAIQTLMA